jgi:Cys-tRNA(Pro)/Cys-tRNA(Cys) deacylase
MAEKENKTNAIRRFDSAKIKYTIHRYEHGEGAVDGAHIASLLGIDPGRVYKTLVTRGSDKSFYVFDIPVLEELDLKKAARAAGVKSVEMIHVAEINGITGYVRGGCSPVGMKKQFKTFFDKSAEGLDTMLVSAGRIGWQIEAAPVDIAKLANADFADLVHEN